MVLASLEKVSAAPLTFGEVLGVDLLYGSCSFKLWLFFFGPGHQGLARARGPRLGEVGGQLWHLDPTPIFIFKMDRRS